MALEQHGTAAGVARAYGVTRASVCQYLTLLRRLPAEVLAEVEVEKDPARLKQLTLRKLLEAAQAERLERVVSGERRPAPPHR